MVSFGTEAVRVTSSLPLNTHPIAGTMGAPSGVDDFGAETVCECCCFTVAAPPPGVATQPFIESLTPTFSTESAPAFRRTDKSKGSAVTVPEMNDR